MNLHQVLRDTAETYACRKVAHVEFTVGNIGVEEPELYCYGWMLDGSEHPDHRVGLGLVITPQPEASIPIVEVEGAANPGVAPAAMLDVLSSIIQFGRGRAGILWLNAGVPRLLAGNALVNTAKMYELSVERAMGGQSWNKSSRLVPWDSCVEVKFFKGPNNTVLMDWLAAAVAEQSDAGERGPGPEDQS